MAHGTRAFLPHMINQGGGAIVNVSSILGICAFPTQSAYCAAKFAARGYTEAVRQELHGTRAGLPRRSPAAAGSK